MFRKVKAMFLEALEDSLRGAMLGDEEGATLFRGKADAYAVILEEMGHHIYTEYNDTLYGVRILAFCNLDGRKVFEAEGHREEEP